jgi:predicted regulator of Ras-like GTPase activity (Roadblock/LC7/MglB family)
MPEYRSDALRRALAAFHEAAPGLHGSALITPEGLVIAVYPPGWDGDIHDPLGGDNVSAMAAVVAELAGKTLTRLAQGQLERVLMEGERGTVGVFPVTHDAALAVLITKDAKLGLTMQAARRAAEQLRAILDQPPA